MFLLRRYPFSNFVPCSAVARPWPAPARFHRLRRGRAGLTRACPRSPISITRPAPSPVTLIWRTGTGTSQIGLTHVVMGGAEVWSTVEQPNSRSSSDARERTRVYKRPGMRGQGQNKLGEKPLNALNTDLLASHRLVGSTVRAVHAAVTASSRYEADA
jgi:hypothetical protein